LPKSSIPQGAFRLVTRRGKQFNSMVHEPTDPINGAPRDAVLISSTDLQKLGLRPGQRIWLQNGFGTLAGQVFVAEVHPGSVQVHWPEGNVLLDPALRSSQAKIPAYKEAYVYIYPQPPAQSPQQSQALAD
jgi:anaerobic selenocysteine-containing dehydrogenase